MDVLRSNSMLKHWNPEAVIIYPRTSKGILENGVFNCIQMEQQNCYHCFKNTFPEAIQFVYQSFSS